MVTPLITLHAPVLTLLEDRIDTDVIFPARFLLLMGKTGLGRHLFHDRRFDANAAPLPNAIDPGLNNGAAILLAGRDFGCGSSREQAVWALADAGFRCIVAESFGEIFARNCLRNGVLALVLPRPAILALSDLAALGPLTLDLPGQRIGLADDWQSFDIDATSKDRLLHGRDEIDAIVDKAGPDIIAFEARQRLHQPWLYKE
jgi:3-isopropylmalate dehydratase small subunit